MATIPEALAAAIQHHQAGRLEMAERIYWQILAVEPDQPDALHLLGVIAHQSGRHEAAIESIGTAIRLRENDPVFHHNLGEAYRALRRHQEAIACYQRALQLKPDYAQAYNNLGNVLKDRGQTAEAIPYYQQALRLKPDFPEALYNLGNAFREQGQSGDAIPCYRRAVQLNPDLAEAHNNLGSVLGDLGETAEAILCYRRAMELKPDSAEILNNLGHSLQGQGRMTEAIAFYRRALQIEPDVLEIHDNLRSAFLDQGQIGEAIACCQRAMELQPDSAATHSSFLAMTQYNLGASLQTLAELHADYQRRHAAPLRSTWHAHENVRDPERRLRLGFLSPDFYRHPVASFLVRVLENLDRHECETVGYSDGKRRDDMTARLRAAASTWREVHGLSDERLAEQIRSDRVDILFDLAGHTADNRLLVFARKPAPVQIAWIGYEGTTGLEAMDYLLADRYMVPEASGRYYREQILRMPDTYLCYDPPAAAPPVGPLPAFHNGYVTFGSFNNLAKVGPHVVAVWAEILRRVPRSRLVMKYRSLADDTVRRRYLELFAAGGVEPERVRLLPAVPQPEHLAVYDQLDVALDPFPYAGTATSCEALWMGVPAVTWPGETFASRDLLLLLSNLGLADEFAARDVEHYVELAVRGANDLERLAAVRAALRDRMAASALCDGRRFAANLLLLLRDVWRKWTIQS